MQKQKRTYLDYNATCPIRPEVIEGVVFAMETLGNPSSIHQEGRQARKLVETARAKVSDLVGCSAKQVIFTSGATESNNMLLKGYAPHRRILISATEHSSVIRAGVKAELIPVHSSGLINLDALKALLEEDTRPVFVSIMAVNSETGVIQPIKEISALLSDYDSIFHTDAAQAVGRIPVYFPSMGVQFLSLSGHKIGGPQGIGVIVMENGTNPPTLIEGGGQERRQRAGTENVAAIHGLGIACEIALDNLEEFQKLGVFQSTLEKALKASNTDIVINGENAPRVANTTSLCLKGFDASTLLMSLDIEGIAVSTGSACSSGSVEPSHVLKAMGHSDSNAKSGLRISTGWATTQDDIDAFLKAWNKILERLKRNA
ncbi:MAG: cysteine desulfurase family protein [Bdellovibrionales bacterium]